MSENENKSEETKKTKSTTEQGQATNAPETQKTEKKESKPAAKKTVSEKKYNELLGKYEDLIEENERLKATSSEAKPSITPKTLSNSANETVQDNVSDVVLLGVKTNPWRLLCKAFSEKEGWMKSTKAMALGNGQVAIQYTTQQLNADGSYTIAEAGVTTSGTLVESEEKGIYMIGM